MNAFAETFERELRQVLTNKNEDAVKTLSYLVTSKIEEIETVKTQIWQMEKSQAESKSDIQLLAEAMKQGFESVNKRFEDMQKYMDKRFETVDKRFEAIDKKFDMMFKFMGLGFSVLSILIVIFKFVK